MGVNAITIARVPLNRMTAWK